MLEGYGSWPVSVCVCYLSCRVTLNYFFSKDGHPKLTSVIADNRGLLSFHFTFDCLCSIPWIFQDMTKVAWDSQRLVKLCASTYALT